MILIEKILMKKILRKKILMKKILMKKIKYRVIEYDADFKRFMKYSYNLHNYYFKVIFKTYKKINKIFFFCFI